MATVAGENASPTAITSAILNSQVFSINMFLAVGTVAALVGTVYTATVTGLLPTDQVVVNCTGTMTSGATIANARVPSNDVLEITFTTAVALGLTMGSLGYRLTVIR